MTHTPNTLPPLPQPWDYCYEWNAPYGTRKFSVAPHNGRKPDATVQVYTADQMQAYARAALAQSAQAPAQPAVLPSEALFGFAGWLTSRDEVVTLSSRRGAAIAAELVDAYCMSQGFAPPRDGVYPWNLMPPPAQPAPLMLNGLTEAETNATASVAGLTRAPAQPAPSVEAVTFAAMALDAAAEVFDDIERHNDQHRHVAKEAAASARRSATVVRSAVEALARDQADAYRAGWCAAAKWADRDDLLSDTDSPAYIKDRDEALARGAR